MSRKPSETATVSGTGIIAVVPAALDKAKAAIQKSTAKLLEKGTKNLTGIGNDPGNDRDGILYGIHLLVKAKRLKKFIGSYHSWNKELDR
jgi:acyl CoA:acetate/3-ketoacid CoA transferase alpha subunit